MEYIFVKAKNTEIKCTNKAGILPTAVVSKVGQKLPELEKAILLRKRSRKLNVTILEARTTRKEPL